MNARRINKNTIDATYEIKDKSSDIELGTICKISSILIFLKLLK
tara:strand:+ start:893 stop:1024 length:132 start_codon:yes stop_codon:yes gene_type:complete